MTMTHELIVANRGAGEESAGSDCLAPGEKWEERLMFRSEIQSKLNSEPFFQFLPEVGGIALDTTTTDAFSKNNPETKEFVKGWEDSVIKSGYVQTTSSCAPTATRKSKEVSVCGVGCKRKTTFKNTHTTPPQKDRIKPLTHDVKMVFVGPKAKKNKTEARVQTDEKSNSAVARDLTKELCEVEKEAGGNVKLMTVPLGVSPLDKIVLYDCKNKTLTDKTITIPETTCNGDTLQYIMPSRRFKLLLVDGDGFKANGSFQRQHMCRLSCHKVGCLGSKCPVLGCASAQEYSVFKNTADEELKEEYKAHWKTESRKVHRGESHRRHVLADSIAYTLG